MAQLQWMPRGKHLVVAFRGGRYEVSYTGAESGGWTARFRDQQGGSTLVAHQATQEAAKDACESYVPVKRPVTPQASW